MLCRLDGAGAGRVDGMEFRDGFEEEEEKKRGRGGGGGEEGVVNVEERGRGGKRGGGGGKGGEGRGGRGLRAGIVQQCYLYIRVIPTRKGTSIPTNDSCHLNATI